MKYCKKCNRLFTDDKNFCPNCGVALDSPDNYDIFGEPLYNSYSETTNIKQDKGIYDNNKNVVESNPYRELKNKKGEILALISLFAFLVPTFGFIISMFSVSTNMAEYKIKKKNLGFLIISIITTILSIIWEIVLIKFGVLSFTY